MITPSELEDIYKGFEDYFESLKLADRTEAQQHVIDYLSANTKLNLNMAEEIELLKEKEPLKDEELIVDLIDILIKGSMRQGWREIILNMIKEKVDISVIARVTNLSEEEIKELKKGS